MRRYRTFLLSFISIMLLPGILFASPATDRADELFEDGLFFSKQRQFDDAIISFVQAVRISPRHHRYHRGLYMTYQATRRGRQGISFYKTLIREHPDNATIHYWLGRYYLAALFLDDAAKAFEESARLAPEDEHPFISLGHVYSRLKKNEEALKAYLQADKLAPGVPVIKVGMGTSYFKLKDFEKAKKAYEEALADDASFTEAQYNLGLIYEKNKEYDKAFDQWQILLEADPNESGARERLARLYYRGGFYLDAVREYRTLSLVMLGSARVFLALGEAQVMLASELSDEKDRDLLKQRAVESFKRTLEIEPENVRARQYLDRLALLDSKKSSKKRP